MRAIWAVSALLGRTGEVCYISAQCSVRKREKKQTTHGFAAIIIAWNLISSLFSRFNIHIQYTRRLVIAQMQAKQASRFIHSTIHTEPIISSELASSRNLRIRERKNEKKKKKNKRSVLGVSEWIPFWTVCACETLRWSDRKYSTHTHTHCRRMREDARLQLTDRYGAWWSQCISHICILMDGATRANTCHIWSLSPSIVLPLSFILSPLYTNARLRLYYCDASFVL